jgi:hypothetical protein
MRKFVETERDRTQAFQEAVTALRKLGHKEGWWQVDRAYAVAVQESRYNDFAKNNGKESSGHCCIARLVGKRCRQSYAYGIAKNPDESRYAPCSLPAGVERLSFWLKEGKPSCYVSEPYDLGLWEMKEIAGFCDEHNLDVRVSAGKSWYFPGQSLILEVRPRST